MPKNRPDPWAHDAIAPARAVPAASARAIDALIRQAGQSRPHLAAALAEGALRLAVMRALAGSPFLSTLIRSDPDRLERLASLGPAGFVTAALDELRALSGCENETDLMSGLRNLREAVALAIALADLAEVWSLEPVVSALSDFAETACQVAADWLLQRVIDSGQLVLAHPKAPPLTPANSGFVVLGMGKLGGRELNYSSDIDLIVLFDSEKVRARDGGDAYEILVRLTQRFVRLIHERTGDGYVQRVDLRLRPDPNATPVALSFEAAEYYYQSAALTWERAAFIKARPVAGDIVAGHDFLERIRPFIWRRSVDFSVARDVQDLTIDMQQHFEQDEFALPGFDVKRGRGGIRQIEFYIQVHQLLVGGRDPRVRATGSLDALQRLVAAGRIGARDAALLEEAYRLFRMVEHRLQMVHDHQTQILPRDRRELTRLAALCGFSSFKAFETRLTNMARKVDRLYAKLAPPALAQDRLPQWPEALANALERRGFPQPQQAAEMIDGWRRGRYRALRTDRARDLLEQQLSSLLDAFVKSGDAFATLVKFDNFLSRLPSGVQLLSLFEANPQLMERVNRILSIAPSLGDALSRKPALLDRMLDPDAFKPLPSQALLEAELGGWVAGIRDLEEVLDLSRRWVNERRFLLGTQFLDGAVRPDEVRGNLARLAEVAIAIIVPRVCAAFAAAHGQVAGRGLQLLALGRFGGGELHPGSDLDMLFLFDDGPEQDSDGTKPLSATLYFNRLSQRIITSLSAATAEGSLYEIDTRLRPSGNKGLLAVSRAAFLAYERDDAWTWEHMALTRARCVWGDPGAGRAIERDIAHVLGARRADPATLRRDIMDMRAEMDQHRPPRNDWDLKLLAGGLIDLEFIIHYLQLRSLAGSPDLLSPSLDRAIERLAAAHLIDDRAGAALREAVATLEAAQMFVRLCFDNPPDEAAWTEAARATLARAMGKANFRAAVRAIGKARQTVQDQWKTAFGETREALQGGLTYDA